MTPPPEASGPHRARDDIPAAEFGGWKVLLDGTLVSEAHRVTIYPDRLPEGDWWLDLSLRPWMRAEWNDFIPAFRTACVVAGIDIVNLKMTIE